MEADAVIGALVFAIALFVVLFVWLLRRHLSRKGKGGQIRVIPRR